MIGHVILRRVKKKGSSAGMYKINQQTDSLCCRDVDDWKTYECETKHQTRRGEQRWEKVLSKNSPKMLQMQSVPFVSKDDPKCL